MSLNIKNERVHALAREVARRTGRTQTNAIEEALVRLLADLDAVRPDDAIERAREIAHDFERRLSAVDRERLSTDRLYDDRGLPA